MRTPGMRADPRALEAALGHVFQNRELLGRALTHSSHVHESNGDHDNEQLEFLGDSIIGFLVCDALVARFPEFSEGRLSTLKAHLVSAAHLYEAAVKLDLGKYLHLGRGEEMSGGRAKRTLLVDCFEALIAAIYLDGGIEPARGTIYRCVLGDGSAEPVSRDAVHLDFKTALQELARARNLPLPRYLTVAEDGPPHARKFIVEARVGPDWTGQAEGLSKKTASQKAAKCVFEKLSGAIPGAIQDSRP
ncbi:MAG: ribonuclease III [Acidobacteriota bacterium]|nr:ribonuclease III [Acidobacteriota bacterium]